MNPSYFRIKLPMAGAVERLFQWNEKMPKEKIETTFSLAVDKSINESGQWKGSCLYVYEKAGWTVFEDLSGGFVGNSAMSWKAFAQNNDLVVAGYNEEIPYGELIILTNGVIQKEFLEDERLPKDNVNYGGMYSEIKEWIDVASFVDNDEIVYSEHGMVLIF